MLSRILSGTLTRRLLRLPQNPKLTKLPIVPLDKQCRYHPLEYQHHPNYSIPPRTPPPPKTTATTTPSPPPPNKPPTTSTTPTPPPPRKSILTFWDIIMLSGCIVSLLSFVWVLSDKHKSMREEAAGTSERQLLTKLRLTLEILNEDVNKLEKNVDSLLMEMREKMKMLSEDVKNLGNKMDQPKKATGN